VPDNAATEGPATDLDAPDLDAPDLDAPDLDAVADELYGVPPDDFVAERDAAVARARERGDRELARAIGKLRRPTRPAWLANLLVRHRREQLDGLLGLAAGLADAQRTLDGPALRQLSSRRHQLVAAMAREAGRLAQEAGDPAADSVLRDLQGILEAALAQPEIAGRVRSGRLTRTVSYTGFGPAAEPGSAPVRREPATEPDDREPAGTDEAGAEGHGADDGTADQTAERERAERERAERERAERAERERRERELAAAEAAQEQALRRQDADEAVREEATAARDEARDRVAELVADLDAARERERSTVTAAREADVAAKASARAAGAAATRTARARARLDEL
jgi:hypothetical protein